MDMKCAYVFLRIRSDHNEDQTLDVLHQWLYTFAKAYHHIDIEYDNTTQRRESENLKRTGQMNDTRM